MGCIGFSISSSRLDKYKDSRDYQRLIKLEDKNPDPSKFKILDTFQKHPYLLAKINYPNCKNYEGNKILLYKDIHENQLKTKNLIDPHFSQNINFISPIARFEPTDTGWKMGIFLIESLLKYNT